MISMWCLQYAIYIYIYIYIITSRNFIVNQFVFLNRFALIYQLSKDITKKSSTQVSIPNGTAKDAEREQKELDDAIYTGKIIPRYI